MFKLSFSAEGENNITRIKDQITKSITNSNGDNIKVLITPITRDADSALGPTFSLLIGDSNDNDIKFSIDTDWDEVSYSGQYGMSEEYLNNTSKEE